MNPVCDTVPRKHPGKPWEELCRLREKEIEDRDHEDGKPKRRKRRRVFDSSEHNLEEAGVSREGRKSKLSPDGGKVRATRRRVVKKKTPVASGDNPRGEPCEEVARVKGRKWKDREDEECKPEQTKMRRVFDSSEPNLEEADVSQKGRKSKLSPDGGKVSATRRSVVEKKTPVASGDNPRGESCEEVGRVKGEKDGEDEEGTPEEIRSVSETSDVCDAVDLKTKYIELEELGEGGCGTVFAGFRKADFVPVAIKHIPRKNQILEPVCLDGEMLPTEVAIMLKLTAEKNDSLGKSAPVELMDWYDLGPELIVVMERPVPAIDLSTYMHLKGGTLQESEAKTIMKQLVDAAIGLEQTRVFHRDIKPANILIQTSENVLRVRLIDFGLSCFVRKGTVYTEFLGTELYAPPEFWSYSVYRAGPSTVWQLGIVLYEMVHTSGFGTKSFINKKLGISSELGKDLKDFLQLCLEELPKLRPNLTQLQLHPWLQ